MKLTWLRSISASIGIEGRNTVIVGALMFCGLGIWEFLREYKDHALLSSIFLTAFFIFALAIAFVGLLAKPRPSEVTPKYVLQQIGSQTFYTGGIQSSEELTEVLKAAHNIRQLPLPVAMVKGKATDESQYKELSVAEAQTISKKINEGVEGLLRNEVQRILDTVNPNQLPPGQDKALPPSHDARQQGEPHSGKFQGDT
jgi:hypothetical protein